MSLSIKTYTEFVRQIQFENEEGKLYTVKFTENGYTIIDGPQGKTCHPSCFKGDYKGYTLTIPEINMRLWLLKSPNGYFAGLGNPFKRKSWKLELKIKNKNTERWLKAMFKKYLQGEDGLPLIFSSDNVDISK